MKDIKTIIILLITVVLFGSCSEDKPIVFDNSIGKFVQFKLQVDANNDIIEAPKVDISTKTVSNYTKNNFNVLKIPVTLTTKSLEDELTVSFTSEITNVQGIDISPANTLIFTPEKRVDTIYVNFNQRWNEAENPQIKFQLESASDPDVQLGIPNDINPNNELTINFSDVDFIYQFEGTNAVEIIGNIDEKVILNVFFPNGYVSSEIDNISLLSEQSSNFNSTLERGPLIDDKRVRYEFTVIEDINFESQEFEAVFELAALNNYTLIGSDEFRIRKPITIDRDNSVNTANNFYDLSNPFYRTYGETWMDFNTDGICSWVGFFAFTYPVVVDANHPNAVLFDDNGTTDPNDDVYHHAFRVGFNSPNPGTTTNSFNLKRWFTNESTDEINSPGFNIPEALEFFPENGNSTTNGTVSVIEQDLIISGTNGNTYTIRIEGNGTYQMISAGLYEIDLTLQLTNDQLFGGASLVKYKIYNNSNYTDPEDLNEDCKQPVTL